MEPGRAIVVSDLRTAALHAPADGGPCLFVILFDAPFDVEALE